jgi:hypothetical protein
MQLKIGLKLPVDPITSSADQIKRELIMQFKIGLELLVNITASSVDQRACAIGCAA